MSSPTNTVNSVMQWLSGQFKIWLPSLLLSGVWTRFQALWELVVPGALPNPVQDPLPWTIDVTPEWTMPISGMTLVPASIAIMVSSSGGSPTLEAPLKPPKKTARRPSPAKHKPAKKQKPI